MQLRVTTQPQQRATDDDLLGVAHERGGKCGRNGTAVAPVLTSVLRYAHAGRAESRDPTRRPPA